MSEPFKAICVTLPIVLVMVVGVLWARRREKKIWNSGICAESGRPWRCFDVDSQGGRMYKDGVGNYCEITYNVDVLFPPEEKKIAKVDGDES